MTDEGIVELFWERREEAITELSGKYGRLFMKLAYNITGNREDAEECCNDAYLGAWNKIPPERPSSISTYVCRIVRNLAYKRYQYNSADRRNSEYTTVTNELCISLASPSDVTDEVTAEELARAIDKFLDREKRRDRELFVRRYYFSESVAALAKEMEITENRAAVGLYRQRERLRKYLTEEGYII